LQEERQALLHEGSGSAAVNAFVEVVFDNSDNRFSLENSDEVVLRRTVGAKKDEFFLQRKRATKQEVQSLLEGAGFSKSNPYFMVQQGKIQTLCLMTDAQRLALLQEVAGTTLYEDKKAESLVKMTENAQSIEKINSILEDIDQRLNELKGEKEELTVYQNCDRTRKALEYTLYDKELRKARHVLDHLEHERSDHLQATAELHEGTKQTHDQIQNAEAQLKIKSQALKRNRIQLQNLEEDKTRTVTLKTKLDLQCQELQEQVQLGEETLVRTQAELKALEGKIQSAQTDLEEKDDNLKDGHTELQKLLKQKDQSSRQVDAIYAKQGRGKEYASKEDRDRSLRKQIKDLQNLQQEKQEYLSTQQETLGNLRRSTKEYDQEIAGKKEELVRKTESLQGLHKTLDEKTKNHYGMIDVRKDSWREAESLQDKAKEARETYHQAVGVFRKSMPRATSMGVRSLPKIVEEMQLVHGEQYFGMVMDNMELKDAKFQTAVEASAQNALFHVIVDTDATAARLMTRLEREKLGRVTFMPLNQIRVDHNARYPQSNDVTPLLDTCINYDPKVAKAMQHVFHRKLLARNAEIASEWAEKAQMDCITLDGDLCSRKGALTGGYVDLQKSRLRAHVAKKDAEQTFRQLDQEFRQADAKAKEAEQDVTNVAQEVSRLQSKQSQLSRMVRTIETEITEREAQLAASKRQTERIEGQVVPPVEREIASITGDIGRLQDEIGTELTSALSDDDRSRLNQLKEEVKTLENSISEQSEVVEDLRAKRQRVESLLEDNLLKRRQELIQVYRDDDSGLVATSSKMLQDQRKRELEDRRQHLVQATQDVAGVDQRLEECRKVEEQIKGELRQAKHELDKLKGQDLKNSKLLDEASERSEKLMSKVSIPVTGLQRGLSVVEECQA
jgi:structural maintenance of chromosome 3 (chondroitin sulfate proteoglycan 6)